MRLPATLARSRLIVAASLSLLMLSVGGCDRLPSDDRLRYAVHGEVQLDGKPLQSGAIVFHCLGEGESGDDTKSPVVAFGMIEGGHYRIDAADGPIRGISRVEFRAKPLSREEFEVALNPSRSPRSASQPSGNLVSIPDHYGAASKLQVEILDQPTNRHDFTLSSRAGR